MTTKTINISYALLSDIIEGHLYAFGIVPHKDTIEAIHIPGLKEGEQITLNVVLKQKEEVHA